MPVLDDDGRHAEGRRRAEDRALVVRVGHLIENGDQPLAGRLQPELVLEVQVGQGVAEQRDALMDRPLGQQLRDRVEREQLGGNPGREELLSPLGGQYPVDFPLRIGERRLDGMRPVEPEAAVILSRFLRRTGAVASPPFFDGGAPSARGTSAENALEPA